MLPLDPGPGTVRELQFRGIPHHVQGASGRLGADPVRVAGEARALRPLSQISALASQLVNRALVELAGRDTLSEPSKEIASAILADMNRWCEVLEVATAAARDIVTDLSTQFGVEPMSDPEKKITHADQPVLPLPEQHPPPASPTGPGAVLSGKPAPNPQESNVGAVNSGREPEQDVAAENAAQAESGAPSGDPQARLKVQEAHAAADEKEADRQVAGMAPPPPAGHAATDLDDFDEPPARKGKGKR
jgi:hypothetical protein